MTNVSEYKKKIVGEFINLIKEYPIIGAVNMEGLPTPQLQKMRAQLRGKVVLKMTKRRLLKLALEQAGKKDVDKLIEHLKGHPALLFTKENPFTLFKTLQKNKSTAPAKGGQIAPKDIIVPEGPTEFAPGPVIGELGMIGVKAGIVNGKVAIKADSLVVKEGEVITSNVAALLTRLKIEPMEIGLDLRATYEDGEIFTKDLLAVDEQEYINNITQAHKWSFNLAIEAGVYNKTTIEYMITKAHTNSRGLALSENILADGVVGDILAKAELQMRAITAFVPDVPVAEVQSEPKAEEPKVE